jgi:hypothetical protein
MTVVPGITDVNGRGAVQLTGNVTGGPDDDDRYGGSTTPETGTLKPAGKLRLGSVVGIGNVEAEAQRQIHLKHYPMIRVKVRW